MSEPPASKLRSPAAGHVLLAAGVTVLAGAGYAGYVLYPRFDLPAATGASLLLLATAAGIASFFSPCSFPLLVSLLGREAGEGRGRRVRVLHFASSLAAGAALFLLAAGAGIAAGGGALFEDVTFTSVAGRTIRIIVGSLLITLGLIQWGVIHIRPFGPVERAAKDLLGRQAGLRREHPTLAFGVFGFVYLVAGFG